MRIEPGEKKHRMVFNDGSVKTLTTPQYRELQNFIDKMTHRLYNIKTNGGNTNEINEECKGHKSPCQGGKQKDRRNTEGDAQAEMHLARMQGEAIHDSESATHGADS